MIEYKVNRKDPVAKVYVETEGTTEELADDIGNLIHSIYEQGKELAGQEFADEFKAIIQSYVADDGPVWMSHAELMKEE